jgi:membrane-associated phospholipid phosphatase
VRDVAVCGLQMWAYVAEYKTPHDDPDAQLRRTRFDYPIVVDRVLGLGELPTLRLQRALAHRGPHGAEWRALDRVLVWTHWTWFMVPHTSLLYIRLRHPGRFERAAVMTYAVFDIGASFYWLAPTAPPWYAAYVPATDVPAADVPAADVPAADLSAVDGPAVDAPAAHAPAVDAPAEGARGEAPMRAPGERAGFVPDGQVRRLMVEYGEQIWQDRWGPLYSVLGGNPLAAMPSIHFATSLMAALLLAEAGPIAGALGFSYAITLGFALVYLGEHYVVDLLAGAALAGVVHRLGPRASGATARAGRAVAALEVIAHEAG